MVIHITLDGNTNGDMHIIHIQKIHINIQE